MNPYLQGLLASAFGDQVNKRTGLGDRAYGLLSDLANAILPEAAAADASSIPAARTYPTTTSGEPATTAPYQRKFGAPGLLFREGTPDSERGLNALLDKINQQGDYDPSLDFTEPPASAYQGADDPSLDFTEPPASAYEPTVQPTVTAPVTAPEVRRGAEVIEGPTTPEDDAPGMYPNGKPESETGGGFFDALSSVYDSTFGDEEWRLRKAIALQGMTLNPNPQVAAALNEQLKVARAKRGTPETVQALINMGQRDLAGMVQAGQLSPKEALTIAYKSPKTTYTTMRLGDYAKEKNIQIQPGTENELIKVSSQGDVEPLYDKPLSETAGTETIKAFAPILKDVYDAASSGMKEVKNIDKNLDMLNTGDAFTGMFSEYKKDLARFMSTLGSDLAKRGASQTEILQSALQAGVFKAFVEAGLTSKQMDTPAEREMIMKAFSGDITLTKEALIELQNRRREKAVGNIRKYDEFKQGGAYDAAKQYVNIPYLDTSGVRYDYQYQPPAGMKKKKAGGFTRDASGRLVPVF
jgi:hypothetical protein